MEMLSKLFDKINELFPETFIRMNCGFVLPFPRAASLSTNYVYGISIKILITWWNKFYLLELQTYSMAEDDYSNKRIWYGWSERMPGK